MKSNNGNNGNEDFGKFLGELYKIVSEQGAEKPQKSLAQDIKPAAIALYTMVTTLEDVGFQRREALDLTIAMLPIMLK